MEQRDYFPIFVVIFLIYEIRALFVMKTLFLFYNYLGYYT